MIRTAALETGVGPPSHGAVPGHLRPRPEVLVASLVINVLSLGLPLVILQVYDRILPNHALETFAVLLLGLLGVIVLDGLLQLTRSYITGLAGARYEHKVGLSAFTRLMHGRVDALEREAAGAHLDRINSVDAIREFYGGQALLAFTDLPFVFLFLALIGFIGGWVVIVPIVLVTVFALAAVYTGRKLRGAIQTRSIWDDRRYSFLIEVLAGIHTVKALAMERLMARRYEQLQESCAQWGHDVAFYSAMAQSLGTVFSQVTMVLVAGVGAVFIIDGQMTIGGLAACTMLSGRSIQPLLKAMSIWAQYQNIQVAEDRMSKLFEVEPESPAVAPAMPDLKGAIELQNVSFRYNDEAHWVLHQANLKIEPNQTIAIAGASGIGKSTVLRVLSGLLRPTEGRVLYDGNDIRDFDASSARRQMAFMPQIGVLFRGTLLENLTMFRGDEAVPKALELSRRLGLDSVIAHMPDGLDTQIGEGTVETLPGGIRQRIVFVRELIDMPSIVLFDEANLSFDGQSEDMLQTMLAEMRGSCTMILVSHRPSILRLADKVYELRDSAFVLRTPEAGTASTAAAGYGDIAPQEPDPEPDEADIGPKVAAGQIGQSIGGIGYAVGHEA